MPGLYFKYSESMSFIYTIGPYLADFIASLSDFLILLPGHRAWAQGRCISYQKLLKNEDNILDKIFSF